MQPGADAAEFIIESESSASGAFGIGHCPLANGTAAAVVSLMNGCPLPTAFQVAPLIVIEVANPPATPSFHT